MGVRTYTKGWLKVLSGISGDNLLGDLRLLLCMTNTDADTIALDTPEFLDEIALDECDGANYARLALSSATPSLAINTSRKSIKLTCADHPVFPNLGPGTRNIQGVLMYVNHLADDSQSVPLLWLPYTTPRVPDGGNFTIELPVVNSAKTIYEHFQVDSGTSPITS